MCPKRPTEEVLVRLANVNVIRNLEWSKSGIAGTGDLSPRARRTLACYVAIVKMGYEGVSSPMGAVADAVWRVSSGESRSVRTLQRANAELETAGYIRRVEYRVGKRSREGLIFFNSDAFSYWTGRISEKIIPLKCSTTCDMSHISPGTTSCRTLEVTTEVSSVTSCISSFNSNIQPRAGARAINIDNDRESQKSKPSRKRKNAVLFSLCHVLGVIGDLPRADRARARARAECELKAESAGVELVNPSGVDWRYWSSRWAEMSIVERESMVRREILPNLIDIQTHEVKHGAPSPDFVPYAEETGPTADEIRKIRLDLESRFSIPDTQEVKSYPPSSYPTVNESDPEMALLIDARARARARAIVE